MSIEFRDSILTMINGDRNGWSLRKNFFCRSQLAIIFKMADFPYGRHEILKISQISVKLCIQKFSWLLITNLTMDFRNSKWRIQYGGHEILETSNFRGTLYSEVFMVTDYEFNNGFPKFKMADPIWRTWNLENLKIFAKLCTRGFSCSLIMNLTTNFQNSNWRIQYSGHEILKISQISVKLYSGFLWLLFLITYSYSLSRELFKTL